MTLQDPYYPHSINNSFTYQDMRGGIMKMNAVKPEVETVNRYFNFFQEHLQEQCDYTLENGELEEMKQGVLALDVMPSMRCLMTAGEANQEGKCCRI